MDYNNDGNMDLIMSNYYGKLFLYRRLNDGKLTTEPALCADGIEIDMGFWCGPQLVDWNENGHLDLLLSGYTSAGMWSNRFTLFMNTNDNPDSPVFTFSKFSKLTKCYNRWRQGVRVFDLNQDGKKDMISGSETGEVYFYENIGTNTAPRFNNKVNLVSVSGKIDIGARSRACLIDWNADSAPDMVIGENGGKLYLALGVPGVGVEDNTTEPIRNADIALAVRENPVTGALIPVDIVSPSAGEVQVSLYDLNGRLLCEQQYGIDAGSNSIYLNAADAPPGVALLRAVWGNASVSERVVLTR